MKSNYKRKAFQEHYEHEAWKAGVIDCTEIVLISVAFHMLDHLGMTVEETRKTMDIIARDCMQYKTGDLDLEGMKDALKKEYDLEIEFK